MSIFREIRREIHQADSTKQAKTIDEMIELLQESKKRGDKADAVLFVNIGEGMVMQGNVNDKFMAAVTVAVNAYADENPGIKQEVIRQKLLAALFGGVKDGSCACGKCK